MSKPKMSFVEEYALIYYTPTVMIAISIAVLEYIKSPGYICALIFVYNYLGKFLPHDDAPIQNAKVHNNSAKHLAPLIIYVLSMWTFLGYVWITFPFYTYSITESIALALSVMIYLSSSVNGAHELFHRPELICQIIGRVHMVTLQFSVYPIEHLYLHHKYVGSLKDPITSPKNQSYYQYLINCYYSTHKFAYNYSKSVFAGCLAMNASYVLFLVFLASRQFYNWQQIISKVSIFLVIGMGTNLFMALNQYVEHYGLIYREDVDKKVANEMSSWNSEINVLQNMFAFRYQRHSDHHMNAYKMFTTIQLTKTMPKFPFSFFEGYIMALFPSLWYSLINPLVDQLLIGTPLPEGHLSKLNKTKEIMISVFTASILTMALAA